MNLVGNAIKFTESGEVMMDVARVVGRSRSGLALRRRRHGHRHPSGEQHVILEMFEQVDMSMRRRFSGDGAGPGDFFPGWSI